VKPKLLLDSHVPFDVARAVIAFYPAVDVQHISEWGGRSLHRARAMICCWKLDGKDSEHLYPKIGRYCPAG